MLSFQYFVFDFHMAPAMLFDKIISLTVSMALYQSISNIMICFTITIYIFLVQGSQPDTIWYRPACYTFIYWYKHNAIVFILSARNFGHNAFVFLNGNYVFKFSECTWNLLKLNWKHLIKVLMQNKMWDIVLDVIYEGLE